MFSYNIRGEKPARREIRSMFSSRGRTLRGCLIDDFKSMDPPSDSTDFIIVLLNNQDNLKLFWPDSMMWLLILLWNKSLGVQKYITF